MTDQASETSSLYKLAETVLLHAFSATTCCRKNDRQDNFSSVDDMGFPRTQSITAMEFAVFQVATSTAALAQLRQRLDTATRDQIASVYLPHHPPVGDFGIRVAPSAIAWVADDFGDLMGQLHGMHALLELHTLESFRTNLQPGSLVRAAEACLSRRIEDLDEAAPGRWWEEMKLYNVDFNAAQVALDRERVAVQRSRSARNDERAAPIEDDKGDGSIQRPAGFTIADLKEEAGTELGVVLSKDRWQKIRKASGLPAHGTGGTEGNRRFSYRDIRRLADTAEHLATAASGRLRDGEKIAKAWRALLPTE
ncbi:MAG: hypothetical protein AAFR96_06475 [Planctomycetota bacterium]